MVRQILSSPFRLSFFPTIRPLVSKNNSKPFLVFLWSFAPTCGINAGQIREHFRACMPRFTDHRAQQLPSYETSLWQLVQGRPYFGGGDGVLLR